MFASTDGNAALERDERSCPERIIRSENLASVFGNGLVRVPEVVQ